MPRRAEEETSAPLSVRGAEDEQGFGRGIDLLYCLCLAGWLCGLPLVFSILDFGGLLAWPAAYVSAWPAAGLPPLQLLVWTGQWPWGSFLFFTGS
jgi:hypothetical protein